MTETDFRPAFERAVGDLQIDTEMLSRTAAARGIRIRRRRHAAIGAGLAAAVTVAVGMGATLVGPGERAEDAPFASGRPAAAGEVPLTGRATTAALRDLVGKHLAAGMSGFSGTDTATIGSLTGRDLPPHLTSAMGSLRVTPRGAGAAVPVTVYVTHGDETFAQPEQLPCDDPSEFGFARNCSEVEQGDWHVVRFERHVGGIVERRVHAYDAGRDIDVQIATTDGAEFARYIDSNADGQAEPVAQRAVLPDPPLSFAALQSIATWDEWGPTIPAEYADRGAALAPYEDQTLSAQLEASREGESLD